MEFKSVKQMSATKQDILFIVNPKSGVGSKKELSQMIRKLIDKQKYNLSIEKTKCVGHASDLARDAVARGVDVVVAVGGDGTVNEVARSLTGSDTALGVIPCGSGNGFARHLGIPMDVKRSITFLNTAEPVSVDYGKINGIPFFCTCGVGFDAFVSNSFAHGARRGFLGYMHQTLVDWVNYKPEVYEIETESSKKTYKAVLVACGNASQYGNNAFITPNASMCDGHLCVTILEPFPPVDVPVVLGQLFGHLLEKSGHIKMLEAKWVRIKRVSSGPAHFDGEPVEMESEIFVEIVPSGIKVMASPGWDGKSVAVPLYKQISDMISGSLPKMDIAFPKLDINFPKLPSSFGGRKKGRNGEGDDIAKS